MLFSVQEELRDSLTNTGRRFLNFTAVPNSGEGGSVRTTSAEYFIQPDFLRGIRTIMVSLVPASKHSPRLKKAPRELIFVKVPVRMTRSLF